MANTYGYGMMGIGPWDTWFSMTIMILFWTAVIWFIFWLIKRNDTSESAFEIAKKRFAKGEITKKEFEEIRKSLK